MTQTEVAVDAHDLYISKVNITPESQTFMPVQPKVCSRRAKYVHETSTLYAIALHPKSGSTL